ncbi:hypothetical protein IU500_00995 [Nocardia terpenica]|uniref:hypothetical protein n=1 Tax=Nocardia terpenica TaxID=455432 RepID=UPI001895523C|nr:hypothetical protein [Nocardia terpenica]MBF6059847.1 hypothetical protein [Nocardia terpenica]MBF6102612.1 hypothetical protein [Nocardia terpenica]MBF6111197.1 hypothetical protein [Nocardia terpenica]MBF6117328.1 hypothetical protein [Nocardia terpenica]MBF6150831.1 hypothetical protein [Nocardia terpenica]
MFGKRFFTRVAVAAVGSTAAVVALGSGPALAQGSTTVTPAGAAILAVNRGPVTFTADQWTITCTFSRAGGSVPETPGNHNDNGPVALGFGSFSGEDCSTNQPDITSVEWFDNGDWTLAVQNGSPIAATLTIPQNGLLISTKGARCYIELAPDGPASVPGTLTSANPTTVTFDHASVPVTTSTRNPGCPAATSGMLSATYELTNSLSPSQPITIGP